MERSPLVERPFFLDVEVCYNATERWIAKKALG